MPITKADLAALPSWARVALAAWAVGRVQQLLVNWTNKTTVPPTIFAAL
jgi:hypothetical protein